MDHNNKINTKYKILYLRQIKILCFTTSVKINNSSRSNNYIFIKKKKKNVVLHLETVIIHIIIIYTRINYKAYMCMYMSSKLPTNMQMLKWFMYVRHVLCYCCVRKIILPFYLHHNYLLWSR